MPPRRSPASARPVTREAALSSGPRAIVSLRGADRLKSGHVWIYRSDIVHAEVAGEVRRHLEVVRDVDVVAIEVDPAAETAGPPLVHARREDEA